MFGSNSLDVLLPVLLAVQGTVMKIFGHVLPPARETKQMFSYGRIWDFILRLLKQRRTKNEFSPRSAELLKLDGLLSLHILL